MLNIESTVVGASGTLTTIVGNDVHVDAKEGELWKEFDEFITDDPGNPAPNCPVTYSLCDPADITSCDAAWN